MFLVVEEEEEVSARSEIGEGLFLVRLDSSPLRLESKIKKYKVECLSMFCEVT